MTVHELELGREIPSLRTHTAGPRRKSGSPAARSRKQTLPRMSKARLSGVMHSVWKISDELCTFCNKQSRKLIKAV